MKRLMAFGMLMGVVTPALASDLVIYSARADNLLKPIVAKYEQQTGVKIKLVNDKAGVLIEKLKQKVLIPQLTYSSQSMAVTYGKRRKKTS